MSRTYVHAPAWVKERDPFWRENYIEDHNHAQYIIGYEKYNRENGHFAHRPIWKKVERCDLDVYLALAPHDRTRTACSLQYVHTGRNLFCGCQLCTGHNWNRQTRRAARHQTKKLLRSGRWDDVSAQVKNRY